MGNTGIGADLPVACRFHPDGDLDHPRPCVVGGPQVRFATRPPDNDIDCAAAMKLRGGMVATGEVDLLVCWAASTGPRMLRQVGHTPQRKRSTHLSSSRSRRCFAETGDPATSTTRSWNQRACALPTSCAPSGAGDLVDESGPHRALPWRRIQGARRQGSPGKEARS